jgi:hypothetical protein
MKIKYIIAILAFVSCTSFAQELLTNATWNIGLPVGKTSEFVSDQGWRGFTIAGRRFLDDENSVGLTFGWNIFDERNDEPINVDYDAASGTISGTQIRSVNSFPMMVSVHHHFGNRKDMRPFVGLNVGTYYILQRLDMGVYRIDNDNWHFGLAPEAGLIIPVGEDNTAIYLGGRYNYAFDSGKALGGSDDNYYTYWEINIGFAFSSRWF